MAETNTETLVFHPFGETQREVWENVVRAYCHCIRAQIDRPDKAIETLGNLENEVLNFMEQVFDILEKEELA